MHSQAREVAPRVAYEVWMIREARRLHREASDRPMKNSLLESFLLHARNLHDFFSRSRADLKGQHATDVIAEDFFDDVAQWKRPTMPFLDEHRQRIHRSIAHLTYHRVAYEKNKRIWKLDTILMEIDGVWTAFVENIPVERRAWFGDVAR